MKRIMLAVAVGAALNLLATLTVGHVRAETVNDKPLTEHWWPSEFDASDNAGSPGHPVALW